MVAFRWIILDIYDLQVDRVKRPIPITLNKCFLKIKGCPFLGEDRKGHVLFIRTSLMDAP